MGIHQNGNLPLGPITIGRGHLTLLPASFVDEETGEALGGQQLASLAFSAFWAWRPPPWVTREQTRSTSQPQSQLSLPVHRVHWASRSSFDRCLGCTSVPTCSGQALSVFPLCSWLLQWLGVFRSWDWQGWGWVCKPVWVQPVMAWLRRAQRVGNALAGLIHCCQTSGAMGASAGKAGMCDFGQVI